MASNLTITVDDEALRRARIRALEQGISVNAILREFLEAYAGTRQDHVDAADRILSLATQRPDGVEPNDGPGTNSTSETRDASVLRHEHARLHVRRWRTREAGPRPRVLPHRGGRTWFG